MTRRVVITGLGLISPLGLDVESTWRALLDGRNGAAPITHFDASRFLVKLACEVKGFDPATRMDPKEARRRDRFEQFATAAANEALAMSGLAAGEANAERIGVVIGTGIGGLTTLQESVRTLDRDGPRRINVFAIPMIMPNGPGGLIAIDHGFRGPNYGASSACASAMDAIGQAFELVARGEIDAAVTGGAESTIVEVAVGGFDRTGAMSRRTDNTPQPFDRERDGLVMGEGAGILVLEALEVAQARGATILAEFAGYGATADAGHITQPGLNGAGMARAMAKALARAGVNPGEVSYINAHGTATELNDKFEALAINSLFGPRAGGLPVSSTKSMTGHCMGATGGLEAVFCTLAIRDQALPPTINYHTPDPECDFDVVPNEARSARVEVVLNNAFGFGGHNAATVIRAFR
jgi:beta-ketoacyl-acyl-carrier-protein synthase II